MSSTTTEEVWKWVPGYKRYYKVSNLGRVKSVTRPVKTTNDQLRFYTEKVLRPWISRNHAYVNLRKNGNSSKELVHRLVLLAFVGPCPKGQEGRHFPDRDPTNNKLSNLAWGTKEQNQGPDRVLQGTSNDGERCGTSKLTDEEVLLIRKRYKYHTQRFLAKFYGVSQSVISEAINRKSWKLI